MAAERLVSERRARGEKDEGANVEEGESTSGDVDGGEGVVEDEVAVEDIEGERVWLTEGVLSVAARASLCRRAMSFIDTDLRIPDA